jgi:hypothetical protein
MESLSRLPLRWEFKGALHGGSLRVYSRVNRGIFSLECIQSVFLSGKAMRIRSREEALMIFISVKVKEVNSWRMFKWLLTSRLTDFLFGAYPRSFFFGEGFADVLL